MSTSRRKAATGGNGALTYTAAGLPAGLNFDTTGADANGCTAADFPTGFTDTANLAAAPRVVCCTPTRDGASIVVVTAHDADANRASTDRAQLSFAFTVVAPAAAIAWSPPPTLTEANLHGATLGVPLKQSAFAAGTGASGLPPRGSAAGRCSSSSSCFSGGQLVLVGILGEYLGRVYAEVKRRPFYLVKERLGFPPAKPRGGGDG